MLRSASIPRTKMRKANNDAATTTAPTRTPTSRPTTAPTAKPTAKPTLALTKAPKLTQLVITHGTPHLGGPISDFYGKYGTHIVGDVQAGNAPNGSPDERVGWFTDSNNAYFLSVDYYTPSNIVYYISYSGPSSWSKAQYRDYLLSFAPPGTAEDTATNKWWTSQGGDPFDPIAYTSDIGKFFLHISDGNGYMNTV